MTLFSALRRLQKRTVVVHLLSGASLKGILKQTYRDEIVLSHVTHLDEGQDLEGELVVPRARIDFFQTVTR